MTEMDQLKSGIIEAVEKVRTENPLAGSVTNGVTMDFVANAQLAVGGSAAMVYLPDEGECLVAAGGAVYLNMGTMNWCRRCPLNAPSILGNRHTSWLCLLFGGRRVLGSGHTCAVDEFFNLIGIRLFLAGWTDHSAHHHFRCTQCILQEVACCKVETHG